MNMAATKTGAAAVLMALAALGGMALIVTAAVQPDAGPVSFLVVGMATVTVVTLIRAWHIGSRRREGAVFSGEVWRWAVFGIVLIGAATYVVMSISKPTAPGIIGILLLMLANLVPILLLKQQVRQVGSVSNRCDTR